MEINDSLKTPLMTLGGLLVFVGGIGIGKLMKPKVIEKPIISKPLVNSNNQFTNSNPVSCTKKSSDSDKVSAQGLRQMYFPFWYENEIK